MILDTGYDDMNHRYLPINGYLASTVSCWGPPELTKRSQLLVTEYWLSNIFRCICVPEDIEVHWVAIWKGLQKFSTMRKCTPYTLDRVSFFNLLLSSRVLGWMAHMSMCESERTNEPMAYKYMIFKRDLWEKLKRWPNWVCAARIAVRLSAGGEEACLKPT